MTDTPITRLAVSRVDGSVDYHEPLPPALGLVCRVPERPGLPLYVNDTEGRSVAVYAPGSWASFEVLERAEPEPEAEPEAEEAPELPFKVGDRVRVVANPRGFVSLRVGAVGEVVAVQPSADYPIRVVGEGSTLPLSLGFTPECLELAPEPEPEPEEEPLAPGTRVRVAEGAMWESNIARCTMAGEEAEVIGGPDGDGDYRLRSDDGSSDYAARRFLTVVEEGPEPEPIKVGDRVRVVDAGPNYPAADGDVGTVVKAPDLMGLTTVDLDGKAPVAVLYADRLEKVEGPKFAVGDRVRITSNPAGYFSMKVGDVGEIVDVDMRRARPYTVGRVPGSYLTLPFAAESLEAAPEPEPLAPGTRVRVAAGAKYAGGWGTSAVAGCVGEVVTGPDMDGDYVVRSEGPGARQGWAHRDSVSALPCPEGFAWCGGGCAR